VPFDLLVIDSVQEVSRSLCQEAFSEKFDQYPFCYRPNHTSHKTAVDGAVWSYSNKSNPASRVLSDNRDGLSGLSHTL